MKALTYQGRRTVAVEEVPDPVIEQSTDAIVRITSTAICGSDLHLYELFGPFTGAGDILGHGEDAPALYETFQKKEDGCIKVVLQPGA